MARQGEVLTTPNIERLVFRGQAERSPHKHLILTTTTTTTITRTTTPTTTTMTRTTTPTSTALRRRQRHSTNQTTHNNRKAIKLSLCKCFYLTELTATLRCKRVANNSTSVLSLSRVPLVDLHERLHLTQPHRPPQAEQDTLQLTLKIPRSVCVCL